MKDELLKKLKNAIKGTIIYDCKNNRQYEILQSSKDGIQMPVMREMVMMRND